MIYPLLVFFNSILIFLVPFVLPNNEPNISTNFPKVMMLEHETVLEIKITKTNVTGFATFQMDLPAGFVPREIENAEATLSVNEDQLMWTWTELPEEDELIITIGITPQEVAMGKKTIGASFYYIENNEKKSIDIEQASITVLREGESLDVSNDSTNPAVVAEKSLLSQTPSYSEPAGLVEINRVISDGATGNEKKVDIIIKKGITKGFARFSDVIEPGFIAKALKTDGSSFSLADGKIKFVWVSVPEKEELKISYVLVRQLGAQELLLVGEYSYLEHNQSKKVLAAEQSLRFSDAQLAVEKKETPPEKTPLEKPNEVQKSDQVSAKLETQARQQQNITNFSIQIGAFTNTKINVQTLKRKFQLIQNIRSEFHEDYSKFMFGTYSEYKAARKQREQTVQVNGVKTAFVVAYNNGKRISVQEALMVLNQKWFK